jgi:methionine aminopeptidase
VQRIADVDKAKAPEQKGIEADDVRGKYKTAGEIVNKAMQSLIDSIKTGASVKALCEKGDQFIVTECEKKYKDKKDLKKGIAFPTCLSINNCILSLFAIQECSRLRVESWRCCEYWWIHCLLGSHIGRWWKADNKVKRRKADVILAAHQASQAALRLLKNGKGNYDITEAIQKIAES